MMISLYRVSSDGRLHHRFIFDRAGSVVTQNTTIELESNEVECREREIGPPEDPLTDEVLGRLIEDSVGEGYSVIYGYLPRSSFPKSGGCLHDLTGIDIEPDRSDGIPVWRTRERGPGLHPSYLLFTAFSSELK